MEADGSNQSAGTMAERETVLWEEQDFNAWNFDGDLGQEGFRTCISPSATSERDESWTARRSDRMRDLPGQDDVVDLAAVEDSFNWGAGSSSPALSLDSADGDNAAAREFDGVGPASDVGGAVEQTIKEEEDSPQRKGGSGVRAKEKNNHMPSWRYVRDRVKMYVQIPPAGPFTRADLEWETKCNQGRGRRRETHKVTIPWDRLDDFLEGEMSARQHPCTFVEETRNCRKRGERKQVRAESAVQEIRYGLEGTCLSYVLFPCPCLRSICGWSNVFAIWTALLF